MSQEKICNKCFVNVENERHVLIYQDETLKSILCEVCEFEGQMEEYRNTQLITTKLMTHACMCAYYEREVEGGLAAKNTHFSTMYLMYKDDLLRIADDVEEIHKKGKELEERWWLPVLRKYWNDSNDRGHAAISGDLKVLMWGCAGRVMMTFQWEKQNSHYTDGNVTLIFDDSSEVARGGIQGIYSHKDDALMLLQDAIDCQPIMAPDEKVTMAGL